MLARGMPEGARSEAWAGALETGSILVALGGNALLTRGEDPTSENQVRHAREAAAALGHMARQGFRICVTHGNGPQIGLLALQTPHTPLDVLGAESEGQIGYLLETELSDELPNTEVVALLTQVVVDAEDEAFQCPTKFIGPTYSKEEADKISQEKHVTMKPDGKHSYRRVVASPKPEKIMEEIAIKVLLKEGIIVICAGGGGIPITLEPSSDSSKGRRHGVEAVIDKDAASALLAAQIGADFLLLLTDAPAVFDPSKWPDEKVAISSPITPDELFQMGDFASGSMAPKVQAACRFVRETGKPAGIGSLQDALDVVQGRKGTLIIPN